MNKIFLAASALLLGLTTIGTATAHEVHHGGGHVIVSHTPYFHEHGVRFGDHYFYRGYAHPHFEVRVWDEHYHRFHCWDPDLRCYYYWDAGRDCWYPDGY